jgi:hypothetical protein
VQPNITSNLRADPAASGASCALRVAGVVASAAIVLAGCATPGQDEHASLTGHYEARFVDQQQPKTWSLDCVSESRCVLHMADTIIDAPDVLPVDDLRQARFALAYAAEHAKGQASASDDPFAARLAPLLQSSPEIARCWDLRDPEPDYLLACRLRANGRIDPRMFLFGTVLAGCGPEFCRFDIFPFDEKRR